MSVVLEVRRDVDVDPRGEMRLTRGEAAGSGCTAKWEVRGDMRGDADDDARGELEEERRWRDSSLVRLSLETRDQKHKKAP